MQIETPMFRAAVALLTCAVGACSSGGGDTPDRPVSAPATTTQAAPAESSPSGATPAPENDSTQWHWATDQALGGQVLRFHVELAAPGACAIEFARNTDNPEDGFQHAMITAWDGENHAWETNKGGEDLVRVYSGRRSAAVPTSSFGQSTAHTLYRYDHIERSITFTLFTGSLQVRDDADSFVPGFSAAFSFDCETPIAVTLDQGNDTSLQDFYAFEGNGVTSPFVAVSSTAGFATVAGQEAGYVIGRFPYVEAGVVNVSHPQGMETYDLATSPIVLQQASTAGTFDVSIDRASVVGNGHWIAIYSFDPAFALSPGRLPESVITGP